MLRGVSQTKTKTVQVCLCVVHMYPTHRYKQPVAVTGRAGGRKMAELFFALFKYIVFFFLMNKSEMSSVKKWVERVIRIRFGSFVPKGGKKVHTPLQNESMTYN